MYRLLETGRFTFSLRSQRPALVIYVADAEFTLHGVKQPVLSEQFLCVPAGTPGNPSICSGARQIGVLL